MEGPNAGMVETRWIRLSCIKLYFDYKGGALMEFSAIIHQLKLRCPVPLFSVAGICGSIEYLDAGKAWFPVDSSG